MKSLFFPRLGAILGIFFIYIGVYLFIMMTSVNASDKHSSFISNTFAAITPYLSTANNPFVSGTNTSITYPAPTVYNTAKVSLTVEPTPVPVAVQYTVIKVVRHSH